MALAAQRPRAACPMYLRVCLNGSAWHLDVIMTVMQVRPPRAWLVMPCAINEPLGGGEGRGRGAEGRGGRKEGKEARDISSEACGLSICVLQVLRQC